MTETSTTRKAALWVALVFLLGLALGGLGGYVFAHQKYTVTNAGPTTDAARRAQKVQELTTLANLTQEQSQQVDAIIADIQSQMKGIRKTVDPQLGVPAGRAVELHARAEYGAAPPDTRPCSRQRGD